MNILNVNTIDEIENFEKLHSQFEFNANCERVNDNFTLLLQAYSEHRNDEAMMIFKKAESAIKFEIQLDTEKLNEAYSNLSEDKKIPSAHEIITISSSHKGEYLRLLVKVCYKNILQHLAAYNGSIDDYKAIAELAVKYRGGVFSFLSGLEKEEFIY
jgi:predicted ribonuclease YlaK